jgi:hypothetical protein
MKALITALCLGLSLAGKAFAAEGQKVFEYSFGRELQTVPAVDNDGTIFVGGKGAVGALTSAGAEKWKIELSTGSQADISGITISDDRIYVTSTQGLYAFDKAGAPIWTNATGIRNSKVALDGPNNLYVVDTNGVLRALRADGSERWTNSVERFVMPLFAVRDFGPIVGPSGMIHTMAGNLEAFSGTGEKLWSRGAMDPTAPVANEDGSVYFSTPNIGLSIFSVVRVGTNGTVMSNSPSSGLPGTSVAPPVVGPDKTLYVPVIPEPPSRDQVGMIAFDDNGQIKWRLEQFSTAVSPAVAEDGTIYAASRAGVLIAINSNGSRRWSYTNGVPAVKGLNIGIDGSVLLSQTNGTLLAISGASPVASRVWPVYGRDPRQTSQQRIAVTLTALPVEEIGTNSALFKGELNPQGNSGAAYFEYSSQGPVIKTAAQEIAATNGTVQFSQSVTGLSAGTLYTVRAVSSNIFAISRGEPVSFRTLGDRAEVPPTLASLVAAASTGGTVKFSGDGVINITTPIEFATNAVVDANGHQVVLTGNGNSSLLRFATGVVVTLKGLSLVDGRAANAPENGLPVSKGGALVNNGADLTLIDCLFSNNVTHVAAMAPPGGAISAGGAIWQSGGRLTVQNCRFLTNSASGDLHVIPFGGGFFITYPQSRGGAIYVIGGRVEISNSMFDGNRLARGRPGEGGAIYLANGEFMISSSTLSANSADTLPRGGGIYLASGSLTVTNSTLAKNVLAATSALGGNQLNGSAFGAALFNAGTVLVQNSAILTNETIGGTGGSSFPAGFFPPGPSAGAGIYNAGTLEVENSTFGGNSSRSSTSSFIGAPLAAPGDGSAIYSSGTAGITNVTIAWNIDANAAVSGANATNVVLKNSLLAGGRADTTATNFTDAGHNMTTGSAAFTQSSSQTNVNPRLGPIGHYGGSTLVYPLAAGSPAINAADDAAAPAIDQRGRTRPFGAHADIGAFESSPPFFVWGQIQGYHDPSTTLTVGTNVFAADAEGFFTLGPLPAGTNEIQLAATNSFSLPDPWVIDVQADQESNEVRGFQLHTLTYIGVVTEPSTFQLGAFILAALPGEKWKIDMSLDLEAWMDVTTTTINESGLAEIRVPHGRAVFVRATAVK